MEDHNPLPKPLKFENLCQNFFAKNEFLQSVILSRESTHVEGLFYQNDRVTSGYGENGETHSVLQDW